MPGRVKGAVLAVLAGACLLGTGARAATIDFTGLGGSNGSPFTGYVEHGFTVSPVSGDWLVGQNYGDPAPFIYFLHPAVSGTTTASFAVTEGGGDFTFGAIDLYSSVTPIPYTFTGLRAGSTVFTATGTVPNTFGDFATVTNPDGADIIDTLEVTLFTYTLFPIANPEGPDNIVVTPVRSIPEPTGLTLLGGALGAASVLRLRRRTV